MKTELYRTHAVEETINVNPGAPVVVAGWVAKRRDFGSIVFIDLRDRSGILQLVFDRGRGTPAECMEIADGLRNEYVITVQGTIKPREEKAVNNKIATGRIELVVTKIEVQNGAKNPPFYIQDGIDVDETLRLKHRYLDLRRPEMQRMLMLRHQVLR